MKKLLFALIMLPLLLYGNEKPVVDALWNWENPAESEAAFRKLAQQYEKDIPFYLEIQTQVARAQGLQGKFEEAHKTLEDAKKMMTDEMKIPTARWLLEKGRVLNSSGKAEESVKYFEDAYKYSEEYGLDYYTVDAAHMMGIVSSPEDQIKWTLKGIEIAEKSENEIAKGWLGPLYNNLGWTYHFMEEYEKSAEIFEKHIDFTVKTGNKHSNRIARWSLARQYRALERYDEAFKIQKEIEKELENLDLPPDGYIIEELAELYLVKDENDKAKAYFKKAYDILSQEQWLVDNEPERIERLNELSK